MIYECVSNLLANLLTLSAIKLMFHSDNDLCSAQVWKDVQLICWFVFHILNPKSWFANSWLNFKSVKHYIPVYSGNAVFTSKILHPVAEGFPHQLEAMVDVLMRRMQRVHVCYGWNFNNEIKSMNHVAEAQDQCLICIWHIGLCKPCKQYKGTSTSTSAYILEHWDVAAILQPLDLVSCQIIGT